jgi:hypothetical protein
MHGDAKGNATLAANLGAAKPAVGILFRRGEAKAVAVRRGPDWWCAPGEKLRAAAHSPSSPIMAAAGARGVIQLWNTTKGEKVREWQAHRGVVAAVAFSLDEKALASAGSDGAVRLWHADTGVESVATTLNSAATGLAFSASGGSLFAAGPRECVRAWPAKPEPGDWTRLEAPGGWLAASPDRQTLAVPGPDGTVSLRRVSSGEEFGRLGQAGPAPDAVAYSPDGATLALSRQDLVSLWETATGQCRGRLQVAGGQVRALAFAPDGWTLATGGEHGVVRLWALATGKQVARLEGHNYPVASIVFNGDGGRLATAGDDGLLLWRLADVAALAAPGRERLSRKELDSCWVALADRDAEPAYQAAQVLAAVPQQSVPFLEEVLRPVPAEDAGALDALIALLASENPRTWESVRERLEELGGMAEPRLRAALARKPSPLLRQRIEEILRAPRWPVRAAGYLRALRAVEVLERANTSRAAQLLAALAEGAPGAPLTQLALAARDRIWLALLPSDK